MAALIARTVCDVVVCHAPWSVALFGGVARRAAVPLVFFQHDRAGGRHWTERLARRVTPDFVVCNSRFTAGTLDTLYPGAPRAVLHCPVAPPIDVGTRDATRASLGAASGETVIMQVSRMEAWKGHGDMLHALARLPTDSAWTCWVVGGAQRAGEVRYRAGLERTAAALGIAARVRFLGERTDVAELLQAADVFCHPSRDPEPFGVAVVEALWAGLPVVTAAVGGPAEVVDPSCGMLVPPGDVDALANALNGLVTDAPRRRRLGAGGPPRARAVSDPAVQIPRFHRILQQVPGTA